MKWDVVMLILNATALFIQGLNYGQSGNGWWVVAAVISALCFGLFLTRLATIDYTKSE